MVDFFKLDRAAAEDAGNVAAQDGVRIARDAGLKAEPITVEATGSVWKTIVEIADQHDAATIVMGSRGLRGMRSMLLGSRLQRRRPSRRPADPRRPSPKRRR
jgi:nucleotide-binding universal stress UspA family protein